MAKPTKGNPISYRLDKDDESRLNRICEQTNISPAEITRRGMKFVLDIVDREKSISFLYGELDLVEDEDQPSAFITRSSEEEDLPLAWNSLPPDKEGKSLTPKTLAEALERLAAMESQIIKALDEIASRDKEASRLTRSKDHIEDAKDSVETQFRKRVREISNPPLNTAQRVAEPVEEYSTKTGKSDTPDEEDSEAS